RRISDLREHGSEEGEHKRAQRVARNMFELNRPLEEIVRVAELPLDEVLQLKAEFAGMAQS
ncbi:MAG: hypothetical protein LBB86_10550, partial [Oscillospiraceae bacterium]|nr:hypothetical protein [Oscillospiraceae bacterium]